MPKIFTVRKLLRLFLSNMDHSKINSINILDILTPLSPHPSFLTPCWRCCFTIHSYCETLITHWDTKKFLMFSEVTVLEMRIQSHWESGIQFTLIYFKQTRLHSLLSLKEHPFWMTSQADRILTKLRKLFSIDLLDYAKKKKSCFPKSVGWKNFYHSLARIDECV